MSVLSTAGASWEWNLASSLSESLEFSCNEISEATVGQQSGDSDHSPAHASTKGPWHHQFPRFEWKTRTNLTFGRWFRVGQTALIGWYVPS